MPTPRPTTPIAAVIFACVVKWRGTPSVILGWMPPPPPPWVGLARRAASGSSERAAAVNFALASAGEVRSIAGREAVVPVAVSTHVVSTWIDPPAPLSTITTNNSCVAFVRFATSAVHAGVVTQSGGRPSGGISRRTSKPPIASTTSSLISACARSWLSASTRAVSRLTAMPGTTATRGSSSAAATPVSDNTSASATDPLIRSDMMLTVGVPSIQLR
jgi:hypothetical protein